MENTIPEFHTSRKTNEYAILAIVVLLAILSFGLGRLSATDSNLQVPIVHCETPERVTAHAQDTIPIQETGEYVGSKNGTVYHLPWCSGAKRISEENLIWFASKEEAESKGYRPASNCKGI